MVSSFTKNGNIFGLDFFSKYLSFSRNYILFLKNDRVICSAMHANLATLRGHSRPAKANKAAIIETFSPEIIKIFEVVVVSDRSKMRSAVCKAITNPRKGH